jgi:uncharacterized protein
MKKIFLLLFSFIIASLAIAKDIPEIPNPPRLVNDFSGVLSQDEIFQLEKKLNTNHDTTSTQITIVIENSLDGEDAFDYSLRIAEKWGIGQKGKNNGVLIYVSIQDKKIRIQVGYGLEPVLTDAFCKRVIEEVLKPNFKQKLYYAGLNEATDYLIAKASNQFTSEPKKKKSNVFLILVVAVIILYIIASIFKKRGGNNYNSGGGLDIWTAMLLGNALGSGRGSSYGNFSSGSGSFGGFGGGSFGGGGSGGDW